MQSRIFKIVSNQVAIYMLLMLTVSVLILICVMSKKYTYIMVSETVSDIRLGNKESSYVMYSFEDLQANLCRGIVDWPEKTIYDFKIGPCPEKGIVSVVFGGRTGNQMWAYASAWGASRIAKLDAYVPNCIKVQLESIFENLTLPTFEAIIHCPVSSSTFVTSVNNWISDNQSIILPRYVAKSKLVFPFIHEVVQDFKFKKEITELAQQCLHNNIKMLRSKNVTFIGVHVRRTDYIPFLKSQSLDPADPNFYMKAMEYYKSKFPNCVFVYVSDDPIWCYRQFGMIENVVVAMNHTPAVDMAVLAACNHSVFDYGTFGEWGAILAGGEVVIPGYRKGRTMGSWIKL